MRRVFITAILVILGLSFAFAAIRFTQMHDALPQAEADEIKVNLQFDLDEDIGLFLIDYDVNGTHGAGGISNANQSMLKRDSKDLFWSFDRKQLVTPSDTADVMLKFTVVTQYFEPNYDNIYPEECMIPADEISITAQFGEIYDVIITGNRIDGYQAIMNEP